MAATLLSIPAEIRQIILRHVFAGNVIKATLRDLPRHYGYGQRRSAQPARETSCRILIDNHLNSCGSKQLIDEGHSIYYGQSIIHLNVEEHVADHGWDDGWGYEHAVDFIPLPWLRHAGHLIIDDHPADTIGGLIDCFRRAETVSIGSVGFIADPEDWPKKDQDFMRKLEAVAFYRDFLKLAERYPKVKVQGYVSIAPDERVAGSVHEILVVDVDLSTRNVVGRKQGKQRYLGPSLGWSRDLVPVGPEKVIDPTNDGEDVKEAVAELE